MNQAEYTLESLAVGTSAGFERRIDAEDIDAFARLSGDENELHLDGDAARRRGFRDRVIHGALIGALWSRLVGVHLPGRRSLLLSLRMEFVAPSYPGDTLVIEGTVTGVHPGERVVVLKLSAACGAHVRARGSAMVRVE